MCFFPNSIVLPIHVGLKIKKLLVKTLNTIHFNDDIQLIFYDRGPRGPSLIGPDGAYKLPLQAFDHHWRVDGCTNSDSSLQ